MLTHPRRWFVALVVAGGIALLASAGVYQALADNLGYVYLARGLSDDAASREALAVFRSTAASGGGEAARRGLAIALIRSGEAAAAVQTLTRSPLSTGDVLDGFWLGEALVATGRWSEATDVWSVVARDAPTMELSLARRLAEHGGGPAASQWVERMLGRPGLAPDDYYAACLALGEMNIPAWRDPPALVSCATRSESIAPASPWPHLLLAWGAFQQDQWERAEREAGRAIALGGSTAEAFEVQGRARLNLGRAGDAVESLQRSVALNPGSPNAHLELGQAYLGIGDRERARTEFETALTLAPAFPEAIEALRSVG